MRRFIQSAKNLLGSLTIAVPLLIAIGAILAWGTIYESRFGTDAVQRTVYRAWWFQALLGFLALNLAVAALQRYPWKRRHLPFVLAHASIILILLGGIVGGRFGIHGQLMIPEGSSEKTLELSQKILVVHQANPGIPHAIPTRFETRAWVQEPNEVFPINLDGRALQLTVDRYYPDAAVEEEIADGGLEDNPAVRVRLVHEEQQDDVWLLARDPQRFGVSWGESHVLFLDAKSEEQGRQLLGRSGGAPAVHPRGVVLITLPNEAAPREVPVPEQLGREIEMPGTSYRIAFRGYFPDFAMSEAGLFSQSDLPNNPAVSFTLTGPEGTDPYLLFAFHPDFSSIHGVEYKIPATVRYAFTPEPSLPPRTIGFVRFPSGRLTAVLTDRDGHTQVIDPLELGADYTHPDLGYRFAVTAVYERAKALQRFRPRGNEVRLEALHVVGREGDQTAEAWLTARAPVELALGKEPVVVEYRSAQHKLPVSVKLLDFRKIDYPGSQLAAGFESDVELTDPKRGLILMRKISMNNPLRYRNFSFYQSSFIPGDPEVTILSVRSDPGTPLVYAGFIVVIVGVIGMFILRVKFPETGATP